MNKTLQEGIELAKEVNSKVKAANAKDVKVIIGTPFIHLAEVSKLVDPAVVAVSAQNCATEVSGAYTGEVSAAMVASTGSQYVILGHSERRAMGETNEDVNAKVLTALENGLVPIMCVGETLEQRETGITTEWITMQIKTGLASIGEDKIRKMIILAIPESLQHAIGGGIGLFVAYVGFLNVGFFTFTTKSAAKSGDTVQATPGLAVMNNPTIWLFIIGLVLAIVLTVLKVRGGMLIAIAVTAVVGIPMGQTTMANSVSIADTFAQLPQTFGVIFTKDGFPALFSDVSKLPIILLTIFAFSMSDTFDTIGTFIGTGRRTGIFSAEDEKALENGSGFSSKMDKALFADSIATSIGAICGTSNTTTYVESSAGIAAGGRTGLTSVVVAICFALSAFLSPVISAVPSAATAGVLVIVGCMMAASLKEVKWDDIAEAIPAFFASVFMAFSYSISYGIAGGFITYCIVKTCKKQAKDVHPVIWVVAVLFILDFIITAVL